MAMSGAGDACQSGDARAHSKAAAPRKGAMLEIRRWRFPGGCEKPEGRESFRYDIHMAMSGEGDACQSGDARRTQKRLRREREGR
jgi:hypothetical protein